MNTIVLSFVENRVPLNGDSDFTYPSASPSVYLRVQSPFWKLIVVKLSKNYQHFYLSRYSDGLRVRFATLINDLSLLRAVQTGSGAHTSFSPKCTGGSSGVKRSRPEAEGWFPNKDEGKNCGATSAPPYVVMTLLLIKTEKFPFFTFIFIARKSIKECKEKEEKM
jgi:hypothetical protein